MKKILRLWPYPVVVLTCLVIYGMGLGGGYFFDDFPNLVDDQDWRVTSLTLSELTRAMSNGASSELGRPLSLLSFALNHYFTGADPWPLKLTNVILHAFNALLVFLLCFRLFSTLAARPGRHADPSRIAALAIALAWALHPLQVSSVLYIIQRMELAAQCCVLLALLAYMRGRTEQIAGRRAWPWLLAGLAATVVGLGFKETALLAPGFALLIEVAVFRFVAKSEARSRAWVAFYTIGSALAVVLFLTMLLPRYLPESAYSFRNFTLGERLWTQLPVLTMYLHQIVLPLPDSLHFYYDNFPVSKNLWSPLGTLAAATLLLAMAGLAIASLRRWPLVFLGIAWFFMAHVLTSNVIPLELAFEHRNYLALLGPLLALSLPLAWLGQRLEPDSRAVLTFLPVIAIAGFCLIQVRTWNNPMMLAATLENRNPTSPRASYELGARLLGNAGSDTQSPVWSLAAKQFEVAAGLDPPSVLPDQALIIMAARSDKPPSNEVWDRLRSKLSLRAAGPQELNALYFITTACIQKPGSVDASELMKTFQTALARNPESADIHAQYGNFAWNVLRDPDLAIRMQREAIRLEPTNPTHWVSLAKYLAATTDPASTIELSDLLASIRRANRNGSLDAELAEIATLLDSRICPETHTCAPSIPD